MVKSLAMNPVSITKLTDHIIALFEEDDLLRDVWALAEVSSWKKAGSGHIYFSLKDSDAVISAVMWRGNAYRHTWLPGVGDQILAHGYVGVYPERGNYQFYADEIRPAGRGQLYAQFEALKEKLAAEGLFDETRKRPIPPMPRRLAIVTSPGAAALRDVLRILSQRWPVAEAVLFPTLVQGAEAPRQIAAALAAANRLSAKTSSPGDHPFSERVALQPSLLGDDGFGSAASAEEQVPSGGAPLDTILLVRGGGSIEDLWAFNDEQVAYAIAASQTPVIAGVGHETDFTIADFVADLRAATPTAAAVAAVPDRYELLGQIEQTHSWLLRHGTDLVAAGRDQFEESRRRLMRSAPLRQVDLARQRLDDVQERMQRATAQALRQQKERLASSAARLESLNPSSVLSRGYSILQRADGAVVTAPEQTSPNERLLVSAAGGKYAVRRESG